MELTEQQKQILESDEPKIFINASAAALKTATLTEKARQLLQQGITPSKIAVITFTNMAAEELIQRLGADYKNGIFIGTIHSLAAHFLSLNGKGNLIKGIAEEEEFDRLFKECKGLNIYKSFDWILLDEAQDSGEEELEFIFDMIDPDNFFVVGDFKQCQPEGTQILLSNLTSRKIEDLQIGDEVLSYDLRNGRICGGTAYNSINSKITAITSRELEEDEKLIKVTLEDGKESFYTPNHKIITNLCRFDEFNYLTYLMCDKNNRFRVGVSQLKNSNTGPWRAKMQAEKCEKIWIIDTFQTGKEARVLEDKISYKYSIPQNTFQLDKTNFFKEDLDYIYEGLDTYESAKRCLKDFNRDIRFPFAEKGDNIHYASNAFNLCYACNILPNNMNMRIFDNEKYNHSRVKSVKIEKIEYVSCKKKVYSLKVEPNESYIADGIVTHNSIYGFKGARPDLLKQYMNGVPTYYLDYNFRNGENILDYARRIVKKTGLIDNSVAQYGERGKVIECEYDENYLCELIENSWSYKDWAILTRTNQQIEFLGSVLKRHNIPFNTFKQGDLNKSQLEKKMNEDKVKLITIHSAKGLGFRNVVVYGAVWWNKDEYFLNYVAATRAMDLLVWMKPTYKKKRG